MGEWTPGKWEWDKGDIGQEYSVPYSDIHVDGGNIIIANVNWHIPEGNANARLIAAAPDLYDALRNFMNGVSTGAIRVDSDEDERLANAWQRIHSALAKAEGKDT